ncbi:hypothetical protein [Streptosporangium sp. CA-115845]|uniref:hypothetical protein n=1 Tax=Streptosporangium sp. CA-115845 TaxID=3240071 RepID=UPI003D8D6DA9
MTAERFGAQVVLRPERGTRRRPHPSRSGPVRADLDGDAGRERQSTRRGDAGTDGSTAGLRSARR